MNDDKIKSKEVDMVRDVDTLLQQASIFKSPRRNSIGFTQLSNNLILQSGSMETSPGRIKIVPSDESVPRDTFRSLKRVLGSRDYRQTTKLLRERVDLRSIKEAEKITAGFLSNIESFVSV